MMDQEGLLYVPFDIVNQKNVNSSDLPKAITNPTERIPIPCLRLSSFQCMAALVSCMSSDGFLHLHTVAPFSDEWFIN